MPPKLKLKNILGENLENTKEVEESESGEYESEESEELSDEEGSSWSENESEDQKIVTRTQKTAKAKRAKNEDELGEEIDASDLKDDDGSKIKNLLKSSKVKAPGKSTKSPVRGPGRPRKNPVIEPLPKKGVMKKANNAKNKMELRYGNPQSIKKVFMLLKTMGCQQVQITFDTTKIIIQGQDHLQKSDIYIEIDCNQMNQYYCAEKYSIQMEHDVIASLFSQMTSSTHIISFLSRKREKGDDVSIYVVYTDRVLDCDATHEVPVITIKNPMIPKWTHSKNYPLCLTLNSKDFRQLIKNMDISKVDKFLLQKNGKEDFRIQYARNSKAASTGCSYRFKNPEKINLRSKLGDDEVFSVPISLRYVKKFANAMISDEIEIMAHAKEPTVFVADLDKDRETNAPTFRVMVRTSTFQYHAINKDT